MHWAAGILLAPALDAGAFFLRGVRRDPAGVFVAALLGWVAATAVFCAAIAAGPLWPLVLLIAAALAYKFL